MPWDALVSALILAFLALRVAWSLGRRSGQGAARAALCAGVSAELDAVRMRLKANATFTGCWHCGRAEVLRAAEAWLCECHTRGEARDRGEGITAGPD